VPDSLARPLQQWHEFYLLLGGSAATLVGLVFVALSLGARLVDERSVPALRVFVTPTIVHFAYILVIATVIVMPTLRRMPLGVLLVAAGLVSLGRLALGIPFIWEQRRKDIIDTVDCVWYLVVPSLSYLLLVGAGLELLRGAGRAWNLLALAVIVLLVNGIRNAWDMVVWFAIKTETDRPAGQPAPAGGDRRDESAEAGNK
jgi:hypothetical protein